MNARITGLDLRKLAGEYPDVELEIIGESQIAVVYSEACDGRYEEAMRREEYTVSDMGRLHRWLAAEGWTRWGTGDCIVWSC